MIDFFEIGHMGDNPLSQALGPLQAPWNLRHVDVEIKVFHVLHGAYLFVVHLLRFLEKFVHLIDNIWHPLGYVLPDQWPIEKTTERFEELER